MPGTLVQDALAPKLFDNVDISSATTTTGSAKEVARPGLVGFRLTDATITGADTICAVEVQGSDDVAFGSGVVSYGRFATLDVNSDNVTRVMEAVVYKRYLRAVAVTTGSAVVVNDLTVVVEEPNRLRKSDRTA